MWSRFSNDASGGAVMDAVQKVECLPVPRRRMLAQAQLLERMGGLEISRDPEKWLHFACWVRFCGLEIPLGHI